MSRLAATSEGAPASGGGGPSEADAKPPVPERVGRAHVSPSPRGLRTRVPATAGAG